MLIYIVAAIAVEDHNL